VEDRCSNNAMADYNASESSIPGAREEEAMVTTGGNGSAQSQLARTRSQLGTWREVHDALSVSMRVVGLRQDLATATRLTHSHSDSPCSLKPPSVGQDWELGLLPDTLDTILVTHTTGAIMKPRSYHGQLELLMGESAQQPVSFFYALLVSVGERRIVVSDERQPEALKSPCIGQDWELQLLPTDTLARNFSAHTTNAMMRTDTPDSYHGQLELLTVESAKQPVSFIGVLVSLGEEEIVGTDVRRLEVPPYITLMHSCHVVTTASRLTSC